MIIDLSLDNETLYNGTTIELVGGRKNLITPINDAINIIGTNIHNMVKEEKDRNLVVLTGPMAVWAYLIVFHAVVHAFKEVQYNDGRNPPVTIAKHG